MSRDFILEGIRDILANGINLELDSAEEQEAYFELFVDWYTDNTMYYCVEFRWQKSHLKIQL